MISDTLRQALVEIRAYRTNPATRNMYSDPAVRANLNTCIADMAECLAQLDEPPSASRKPRPDPDEREYRPTVPDALEDLLEALAALSEAYRLARGRTLAQGPLAGDAGRVLLGVCGLVSELAPTRANMCALVGLADQGMMAHPVHLKNPAPEVVCASGVSQDRDV